LIGINDLWYRVDQEDPRKGIDADAYKLVYADMLAKLRQQGDCQIVLMDPFLFCDDKENDMLKGLPPYIEVVHELADEFDATLVPLQQAINEQIKTVSFDKWSDDFVHPYTWAHAWISQQWIKATSL